MSKKKPASTFERSTKRVGTKTTTPAVSMLYPDIIQRSAPPTELFWQNTLSRLLLSYVPLVDFMSGLEAPPPTIASFGSGSCAHEAFLAAAFPESHVHCHDVTEKYIPPYLTDLVLSDTGNISFTPLDLEKDNIGTYQQTFDFVFSIQTLEHIDAFQTFLALLAASVKPNGYLYLDAPYYHMDDNREDANKLRETRARHWDEYEHYHIGFSPRVLSQSPILRDFEVRSMGYYAYSKGDLALMSVFRDRIYGKNKGTRQFLIGLANAMKSALDVADDGTDLDATPYYERPATAFRLLLRKCELV